MSQLKITQLRGLAGRKPNQRETMRTLGLRRIGQTVTRPNTSTVRGQVDTVGHLVSVEEVE
ncbi:large subunit ribosomal protein L30 [Actinopolyspora biskrensis]|uniref:Large ribosomal subunit protein uL30 n=1 Tax=Actinopolyspora biskrensis TaxID=1470178 RepID=A0A852YZY1_9ACTN|nr:50S ribosomal protein L30 [Actinopolyspora biskrensis]NYH78565.1 large subunit ribosomal protein L30 [Actinopolyspora biskrensis]